MSKTVNYDFSIANFVTVKAPYGVNPDTLLDQALEQLLLLVRNNEKEAGVGQYPIEFHCVNTFDADTGEYEPIPEEWYDEKI
jgi:hypothetical protein